MYCYFKLVRLVLRVQVVASLLAVAEGRQGYVSTAVPILLPAWHHFTMQGRRPGGSLAAHVAAQSAMVAALRQGVVLLKLATVPNQHSRRAVLRSRKHGFLKVSTPLLQVLPINR